MKSYTHILQDCGLQEKESAIYLALLELGHADVSEIATKAEIKRPTTYIILDSLVKKGFVSPVSGSTKRYTAEDPKKILAIQRSKIGALEEALPGLIGLASESEEKPSVRFFKGIEGIRAVYEESLLQTPGSEILCFGHADAVEGNMPGFGEWYIKRRVAGGIGMRAMTPWTKGGIDVARRDKGELRHTRLLDPEKFQGQIEMNIYGNKIATVSFAKNELIGIIIESAVLSGAQRQVFEMLWETSLDLKDLKK